MVDIPGVYQDLYIIQYLTLVDSIATDNLSTEDGGDEAIEGSHKYEFPDRENFIHSIPNEEKTVYIFPPILTDTVISYNISISSSTPYLCEHTHED